MVFNNTKVIRARILFRKPSGSLIEIFCVEPLKPFRDPLLSFQQTHTVTWKCLIGHAKKWKSGSLRLDLPLPMQDTFLEADRIGTNPDGTFDIRFSWTPGEIPFATILEAAGRIPLPPYIHRETTPDDLIRYQTVYASSSGSVAAPTAGLHFTPTLLQELTKRHILQTSLTLHVGPGTFRPLAGSDISSHTMHREQISVPIETIRQLLEQGRQPLIAIGTTAVRTLESLYWLGVKLANGYAGEPPAVEQWDPYELSGNSSMTAEAALRQVVCYLEKQGWNHLYAETQLMIVPGYRFRLTDGMVTNFHQPGSTLLLLVAAFLGEEWQRVYRYAIDNGFRFLSYGDSCFFLKTTTARNIP